MKKKQYNKDIVIIGAGLTGLTTAFYAHQRGKDFLVLEKENRIGGQICSFQEDSFVFESGPNTGVLSNIEVVNLFKNLQHCSAETANKSAKKRLIWKGNKFHALPDSLTSAITTPLFSWYDKFRILGEPLRKKGNKPNETIGEMVKRRLGKSFLNYAVDPFLSGIYAGDPMNLVTKYALPKLYTLEQEYGSFIKGTIQKAKQLKEEKDHHVTKEIFSTENGLESLVKALATEIGDDKIALNCRDISILPLEKGYKVTYFNEDTIVTINCNKVVTTVGGYALPEILPFIDKEEIEPIKALKYAPVIQVAIGLKDTHGLNYNAFGGLIPSCEKIKALGILFPSACFKNRAPKDGALFSCFIGGMRNPELLSLSEEEIKQLAELHLHHLLKYPKEQKVDLIKVFKHHHAIPQYDAHSKERLETIAKLEQKYVGLILAGNIRDGIGMADRIKQGTTIGKKL